MTHGSLFSGIGGFDLAAEWIGWKNVFHCEWNEFGQKVLKHYWPKAISYHDITKTDFTIHRGRIDILTGGFPCQPYSLAGKRKGKEDERHLWPEMLRAIKEIQPRWVVGENVLGLVNWDGGLVFHEVQTDLEAAGYEVFPYVLPACAVNAPHRRDRVWFVAYSNVRGGCREKGIREHDLRRSKGKEQDNNIEQTNSRLGEWIDAGVAPDTDGNGFNGSDCEHEEQSSKRGFDALGNIEQMGRDATDPDLQRCNKLEFTTFTNKHERQYSEKNIRSQLGGWSNFPTQSPICSRNDGLPSRLDRITFSKWRNESIKAAGNAIVPQVVYQIFKAIQQYEELPRLPNQV